ncbi:coproporphyrinogen III oxidase [Candidatus Saganbacteria bacterium CG08_land_8_20_14_0_20_45_16]|uniref:Heme chaperone HemW n=1 Tax=Candidatus Saganbacteria bacterium CG08_land_8_20_14_0_20_45_16 TaxID=2014293 RepID=A0A2H0XW80_UNCSA|nr:MAG: coproporphyrinogen III oxidase [Candidatus Saganbacteria bacterium CG08_land_8_20_14_0_20_45_16]
MRTIHDSRFTIHSLYIHIPFCKKKCNYCDFVSYAGKEALINKYIETVCQEIASCFTPHSSPLTTIYFGGGTPTLLSPKHFEKIFQHLTPLIPLSITDGEGETRSVAEGGGEACEISIEANPGTANKAKLKTLRELGINRLSIGAQSFNDRHLKVLGRIHTAEDILRFYDDSRAAGFDNINLDLIFALPNQTLADWQKDLQTAMAQQPNHLSTYNLQIEDGTPFWTSINPHPHPLSHRERGEKEGYDKKKNQGEGVLELPNEETELAMYEYTIETLTKAGYTHYEISNFSKPGYECQHNISYWLNKNYLGIGAGAHSHINGKRWSNPNCIEKYIKTPSSFLPLIKGENVDPGETIFMGLRLLDGISKEHFNGFEKEVTKLTQSGLLIQDNHNIKLTRKGLYLANEVFKKFV